MSALDDRRAAVQRLTSERLDVLIVGGGIVGSGALLDAASRGLRAALIEQDDIASGTSSRSSRLIHGGLRYLEQFRFGLVFEALAERARLLRLAPHLVRLEPLLFPVYGLPLVHRAFYGSGILLYDLLGSRREGGFARHLGRDETLEWTPVLRRDGLRGSIVYHDGVEDDARYTLAVLRTAVREGATAATRVRATGPLERAGRVVGVQARDLVGDTDIEIEADRVVDATGVWTARPDAPLGGGARVLPSKGAHLVVRRDRIPSRTGLTIRVPGRIVFLVPWPGHWLIGTTDAAYDGPVDRPSATADDVEELLDAVNRTLDVDLTRNDVLGTYAGLRPLAVSGSPGSTVKASREHRVTTEPNGLVRVTGGKYTTYRVMAQDAIDAALGRDEARRRPSATAELRLVGALPRTDLDALSSRLVVEQGIDGAVAARLVARHGSEAREVVAFGKERGLLNRLAPDVEHVEAEVAWAARHELALSLDDVLARRTRLAQERPDRAASIAPRAAEILGGELGWDGARQSREVTGFLAAARHEFDVPPATERAVAAAPAAEPA
ncbi:MAG: glycerol-3-phosphate dehydrogenase/oxidase [Chloroflexota bacterium]